MTLRSAAGRRRARPVDRRKALRARLDALGAGEASPAELEAVLREALGLYLGCPAGAVERSRLDAIEGELGAEVLRVYGELEEVRYGGAVAGASLTASLTEWVRAIAKKLLKKRRRVHCMS